METLKINSTQNYYGYQMADRIYDMDLIPLSGRFKGKGVVLVLRDKAVDRQDD